MTTLKCKLFTATARVPERAHAGDAGLDVFLDEPDGMLYAGETRRLSLGVGFEIPPGCMGLILPRSSTSLSSLMVHSPPIDSTYRGPVWAIFTNLSREHRPYQRGQKLAQLVIVPCLTQEIELVDELSDSARGEKAFGSSGSGL